MEAPTMQKATSARDLARASSVQPERALADFEYILCDLRPLLTVAECTQLDALEARVEAARTGRLPYHLVHFDVQQFVHAVVRSPG